MTGWRVARIDVAPHPPSLPTLPLSPTSSPHPLPHPPFPPSNKFIVLSSLSKALVTLMKERVAATALYKSEVLVAY